MDFKNYKSINQYQGDENVLTLYLKVKINKSEERFSLTNFVRAFFNISSDFLDFVLQVKIKTCTYLLLLLLFIFVLLFFLNKTLVDYRNLVPYCFKNATSPSD